MPALRPNVLVILTDDQAAHGTLETMPHTTSWLVDGGTRFTDAFATTPLCCPARSTLLTGMYAHNTGIHSNGGQTPALVALQPLTIERALHDAGYATAIAGKYFNRWPNDLNPAYFDRWSVTPHVTYSSARWNVDGTIRTERRYSTDFIRQQALSFLNSTERHATRPWFLYVAPMAPHLPATPALRYARTPVSPLPLSGARKEADRSDKPAYIRALPLASPSKIEERHARMIRSLRPVDDLVQALMARLRALSELDDTLVVFASDNGYLWGEHGAFDKSAPYLPSVKVPLILRWPGHVAEGVTDNRLAGLLDLAPTIYDATGVEPTHRLDGIDLLHPDARRSLLLLEYWRTPGSSVPSWEALVTRGWEFVRYGPDGGRFQEYYDLRRDPQQLVNLLHDGTSRNDADVTRLEALLDQFAKCAGMTCPR